MLVISASSGAKIPITITLFFLILSTILLSVSFHSGSNLSLSTASKTQKTPSLSIVLKDS